MIRVKTKKRKKQRISVFPLLVKVLGITLMINLFTIVGVVAACNIYAYCTTSPYFSIADVSVSGNVSLGYEEIVQRGGGVVGENMFLVDIADIYTAIESHPAVKSVSVEKRYPSQILISLLERKPFVIVDYDGKQYVTDKDGVILPNKKYLDFSLPHLTGITLSESATNGDEIIHDKLSKGIAIVHVLKKMQMDMDITSINVKEKGKSILLTAEPHKKIVLDNDHIESGLSRFKKISMILGNKARQVKAVDLSFKDKAVVTWLTG